MKWLIVLVPTVAIILRLVILREATYRHVTVKTFTMLAFSCAIDIHFFIACIYLLLYLTPRAKLVFQNKRTLVSIYLAIAFPEMLKIIAILLHAFDSESSLLFLFGLLIISIQFTSLQCLLSDVKILFIALEFIVAVILRVLLKRLFFSWSDIHLMGVLT